MPDVRVQSLSSGTSLQARVTTHIPKAITSDTRWAAARDGRDPAPDTGKHRLGGAEDKALPLGSRVRAAPRQRGADENEDEQCVERVREERRDQDHVLVIRVAGRRAPAPSVASWFRPSGRPRSRRSSPSKARAANVLCVLARRREGAGALRRLV